MALKIVWSKRADQGYARIVKHLQEEWTDKEIVLVNIRGARQKPLKK